jgi:bifunctional N-acetylglucosamine-1-phosphate-uridyltransferase/glucosamine-1-phosphate-acetyltransferase GlmU-like protein
VQLVVLAAGHGRRFGGLKQLAPVGPRGEALMDYTAICALSCGFDEVVLVVRDEIRDEIEAHVRQRWPSGVKTSFVCQPPTPGTAQAVAAARAFLNGPFAVANADDLYGEAALRVIHDHIEREGLDGPELNAHVLVGYRLMRTIITSSQVKRGLCEEDEDGNLRRVVEHAVKLRDDGRFDATPIDLSGPDDHATKLLTGAQRVSMNLWGFHHRILDALDEALSQFKPSDEHHELLLVDVVGALVASHRDRVRVLPTEARCLGITHQEDLPLVRRLIHDEDATGSRITGVETSA